MTKHNLLVTASSIALLASIATAGMSQTPGSGGGRGGEASERNAIERPVGKSATPERKADPQPKASDRAVERASPKSRVEGKEATPRASDRAQEKSSPKSAVQGRKSEDDDRGRSDRGDDGDRKDRTKQQSEKSQGKDRDRSARDATNGKDGDRSARGAKEQRGDGDRRDQADGPPSKGEKSAGDRSADRDRAQLSEQKRTTIRERIEKSARGNRVTKVNFDIRVGVRVPRQAPLRVLPPTVVEIVPEYRGYRYVYVRDEIVIVHPTDYVIVAVIGGHGHGGGGLILATDERAFIRSHIDFGTPVRLGIGDFSIGMSLPQTLVLRPVPDVIVQRYAKLRGYRYFVHEKDVVVVEPKSRKVALVIED